MYCCISSPPHEGDHPTWLIEKRSSRRREAQLHRDLLLWQTANPSATLLPRVYGVLPHGDGWRLFQAYVPHPVVAPGDAARAGQLLAHLAFGFHHTMAAVNPSGAPRAETLVHLQQQRLRPALEGLEALTPDRIDSLVARLVPRLASQQAVVAHNDLHWDNIRATEANGEAMHQLIDLGRVGWNLPGAEFHSALRRSLLGDSGPPIWLHAIDHYAELSRADPTALKLACLWFGLVHGAGVWRQLHGSDQQRARQREARLLTRMVSRLEAQLEP